MNRWFFDKDKRPFAVVYLLLEAALILGGYYFGGSAGALWAAFCSLGLLGAIALQFRLRALKLQQFCNDLDRVLHGTDHVDWDHYAEGELAVLQNEIRKLTLELRDRAAALDAEKKELADSLADISHQMRTPLTSVNLILSMLNNPDLSQEQRLEGTRDLQRMMQRMDWLINALLKMSRLESGAAILKKEPIAVRQLIQKAAEPLAIPMELRNQQLKLDIKDFTFSGDFAWTVEALGNVLKNCMEHTPNGGKVTVQAEENALYGQISVTDTGKGIDPKDLPHLFERFYRGKNADAQSIGIGLALSRMIVSGQNGTIKAENLPRGGARFILRFYKGTV